MTETVVDEAASPTILMVDDAPANLGVVVETLELQGFRVLVAEDGDEALQRAILVQPDLILLDIMMPGIDGFAVCRRLKELDHTRHIPVIFMTALGETPHKVAGFKAGAVDYLTKPLQLDEVVARVKTHLQLRAMQHQLQEQNTELQRYRAGLEQQVAQRTAELSASNRQLQEEIAERRQAEDLLHTREQEYRTLAENSPDVLVRFDRDCRRIYVNRAFLRVNGVTAQEVCGKTPLEFSGVLAAQAAVFQARIRRVLETATPADIDIECRTLHGEYLWYAGRAVPEYDRLGQVASVLVVARDISRQKQMEQALRKSEQQFRMLAENSPNIIIRYDQQCRRIFVNPAYVRETGMPASQALSTTPADAWHPAIDMAGDAYMARLRQVMASGEAARILLEWTQPLTGRCTSHEFQVVAEYGPDRQVIGALAIGHDITALRRHEELENLRLRIFERLAQGGALVEILDLVVAYVERAYSDLLGSIMLADAEGKQLFVAAAPNLPQDYCAAIDGIDIADGIGSCGTAVWRGETVVVDDIRSHPYWRDYKPLALKHGLLACWSEPILDSSGKVLGTFGIYRREPGHPSAQEMELVRQACHLAAIALERKRAEVMLRESEQRYREIFDNVSDILYLLEVSEDRNFRYIEVNPAFEKMVGLPRSNIVGKYAGELSASATAHRIVAQYRRCLEAGEQIDEEIELELAGATRNYHSTLTPVYDADGRIRLITGIARDITERHQVEALRHAREQEFRALVEHSPDTIIRYDRHCRRIYVNPAYEQLAGTSASAWLGKTPVEASILAHMASPYQDMLRQVVATGTPAAMQLDLPPLGNRPLYHYVRAAPEFDRDGQVTSVLAIGWDITELKEAERRLEESRAQLRELAFRRETAREQERKRIAREMHDELGQRLTALRMDIAVLRLRFGKLHPDLQQQVQSTLAAVDSLIQVVRNVASSLRPSALDMGIASALEWLANEFRQRSGMQCELLLGPGEMALDEQQATAVFRLVQESLTNVTRHAQASRVTIGLERREHHYLLQIGDDGQGFNPDEQRKKSFGLIGMRERVLMLGGELSIHTAPGQGVTIQARIPLARC